VNYVTIIKRPNKGCIIGY